MRLLKYVLLFSIIILYNCSTPYQPKGMLGGYSEEMVIKNLYKVEFKGNQHTDAETIQRYLMYRCAELTEEKGYDYFTVGNEERHFDEFTSRQQHSQPFKTSASASRGLAVSANPDLQNATSSTDYTGIYYIKFIENIEDTQENSVFSVSEVKEVLSEFIK